MYTTSSQISRKKYLYKVSVGAKLEGTVVGLATRVLLGPPAAAATVVVGISVKTTVIVAKAISINEYLK